MNAEDGEELRPEGLCFGAFAFSSFQSCANLMALLRISAWAIFMLFAGYTGMGGLAGNVTSAAPPGRCVVGWVMGFTGGASLDPWLQAFAPLGRGEDDPMRARREEVEQLILGDLLRMNMERSGA